VREAGARVFDDLPDIMADLILQLRGTGPGRKNVLRIVPPMTTTDAEIDRTLSILDNALAMAVGRPPKIGLKGAIPTPAR
jgi:4-aminobutyrate aminotransferase-like enzyme